MDYYGLIIYCQLSSHRKQYSREDHTILLHYVPVVKRQNQGARVILKHRNIVSLTRGGTNKGKRYKSLTHRAVLSLICSFFNFTFTKIIVYALQLGKDKCGR